MISFLKELALIGIISSSSAFGYDIHERDARACESKAADYKLFHK